MNGKSSVCVPGGVSDLDCLVWLECIEDARLGYGSRVVFGFGEPIPSLEATIGNRPRMDGGAIGSSWKEMDRDEADGGSGAAPAGGLEGERVLESVFRRTDHAGRLDLIFGGIDRGDDSELAGFELHGLDGAERAGTMVTDRLGWE